MIIRSTIAASQVLSSECTLKNQLCLRRGRLLRATWASANSDYSQNGLKRWAVRSGFAWYRQLSEIAISLTTAD